MTDRRVMIVTGSRTGIGRGLAEYFCRRDWQVVGCSRGPAEWQDAAYHHVQADVSDEDDVSRLFAEAADRYGRLDALVANAGRIAVNPVLLTPAATFEAVYRTNVLGTFLCCRAAAKRMMPRRTGRIVNLSSVAVPMASPGTAAYGSSKAAVEQLTRVLAAEVAPLGITVTALGLSVVDATGMAEVLSAEAVAETVARSPLGRPLTIDEVAAEVDRLLQADPDEVRGRVVYLGGP